MDSTSSIVLNLARSARRWPRSVALKSANGEATYEELWARALRVASGLRRGGFSTGDRAALILGNSADYVACYYGILAAGGIAVALNAAAKARDLRTWLQHSGARWLFSESTNGEVDEACRGLELRRMDVDDSADAAGLDATALSEEQLPAFDASMPAAMLYTSGTTGAPKGVLLSHRNLVANTAAILDFLSLTERDVIVNVLPFYYSYGSSVLHTHICAGAQIVLADNLVYPHLVVEAISRHHATGFAGVPSTFLLLLSRGRLADYDVSSLRYVTQAGGAMAPAVVKQVQQAFPAARVYVMYGQTEATARISWLPPERLTDKLGSVGIPVAGVTIRIRREDGTEAATGETGEVWISGPNVMLGYWADPEATGATIQNGWLRTGDIGFLDGDGFLFLAGRRSDMIKTGAHRVHPQDIEDVIMEVPGVAEVAVVSMEDEILGEAVRAVVVARDDSDISEMQIKAHCRARLANYKVPKKVEFRTALPRTTSGKIRRHELIDRKPS